MNSKSKKLFVMLAMLLSIAIVANLFIAPALAGTSSCHTSTNNNDGSNDYEDSTDSGNGYENATGCSTANGRGNCSSNGFNCISNSSNGTIAISCGGWANRYTNYVVQRSYSNSNRWQTISSGKHNGNRFSYVDSDFELNTAYKYRVRGYYVSRGNRYYSAYWVSNAVSCNIPRPAECGSVSASSNGRGSANVSWGRPSGSNGFEVYCRSGSNGNYSYRRVASVSSNNSSCHVGGLQNGRSYCFVVRSYKNISGRKVYSNYSTPVYCTI